MKPISWLVSTLILIALSGCNETAAINKPDEISRPVPIELVNVADKSSNLRFPGRVRAAKRADLTFNVSGRIIELPAIEGKLLQKGDLVARLDDANYKTQLRSAQASYDKARVDYQRVEKLWKDSRAVSKSEVDKQRTAFDVAEANYALVKKDFDDTHLVAPFTGVVAKRHIENYSNVQSKQSIISLQDLNNLEIVINVPERIVRSAPKNMDAYAVFTDHPDQLLPVTLKSFASESDSQTQSYEVVLSLESGYKMNILPGMSVEILSKKAPEGLANNVIQVPLQAIYSNAEKTNGVWVFNPETSRVSFRKVELGEVLGTQVVIKQGLTDYEKIVTAGVGQLREGMLVRSL